MIIDELKDLLKEKLNIEASEEDFDKDINDFDIDSIDMLDFIMAIEDKYGFEFSDDELDSIKKFDDIVELIESKN